MKKFGLKNQSNEINNAFNEIEDINDDYFEKILSKKFITSNKENNNHEKEEFFIFKKTNQNSTNAIIENHFPSLDKVQNKSKNNSKFKRLSDLEQNNLYFILKIQENSNKEEIKKAYKNLCKTHHPDKGGDSESFNKINTAYKILSNDICRKIYDKFSSKAFEIIEHILSLENEKGVINYETFSEFEEYDLQLLSLLIIKK